jgi:hypothetical protein
VTKNEARIATATAVEMFLANGGMVEHLKGRKNPKPVSARGKFNSGMKLRVDPTAHFPKKSYI